MCQSGDLEADRPPRPAFYNQPTIAADIFTMPQPTKLYISIINIISIREVQSQYKLDNWVKGIQTGTHGPGLGHGLVVKKEK